MLELERKVVLKCDSEAQRLPRKEYSRSGPNPNPHSNTNPNVATQMPKGVASAMCTSPPTRKSVPVVPTEKWKGLFCSLIGIVGEMELKEAPVT